MSKSPAPPARIRMLVATVALMLALVVAVLPTAVHAAPDSAPQESAANSGVYKVKRGDTLGEIARYYGVTVRDIMVANNLSSSQIYVGQRLYIPAGGSPSKAGCTSVYRVKRGDTLTKIAKHYNMNVGQSQQLRPWLLRRRQPRRSRRQGRRHAFTDCQELRHVDALADADQQHQEPKPDLCWPADSTRVAIER